MNRFRQLHNPALEMFAVWLRDDTLGGPGPPGVESLIYSGGSPWEFFLGHSVVGNSPHSEPITNPCVAASMSLLAMEGRWLDPGGCPR